MIKALLAFLCGGLLVSAQTLPVKKIVLYKNGVGYFEHVGAVRGSDSVTVGFTSAQLNDVLKSLTVLDLNGGQITGVGYDSAAPAERRLSEIRLPAGEKASAAGFLGSMRGSKVEVRNGAAALIGRVLGVESRQVFVNGRMTELQTLSLLTEGGELRSAELTPTASVRLLEPGLNAKFNRYLDVVSTARSADERRMVISTAGTGERRLFVSYISEVPVWKSTYRVVLDGSHATSANVQAWAIIDNTVGEDWNGVELSLVAGAPQSFVQNLSQPYYAKRPVVPLPEFASTTPQTQEATLQSSEDTTAQTVELASTSRPVPMQINKLTETGRGIAGGVIGGFIGGIPSGGTGGGSFRAAPPPPVATAQDLGDLFEYKLDRPITVAKNRSALVPIAQTSLPVEKVSVWNESFGNNRPQRALWLTNSSKLTLDGGTVSIVDSDAFSGEGLLNPIHPGEKRLLSYATDLALNVSAKVNDQGQQVTRVSVNRGTLQQETEVREKKVYTMRNTDSEPRRLLVEHPIRSGYELRGDLKPVETTNSYWRFALSIAAGATASLTVQEARNISTTYAVSDLTPDHVWLLVHNSTIDSKAQNALEGILAQKKTIAALRGDKDRLQSEKQKIYDDQQRLRENIKALRGTPEEKPILMRYTSQLNAQEDRLPQLDRESAALDARILAEQANLNLIIESLSF